jgi:hypothetical protein
VTNSRHDSIHTLVWALNPGRRCECPLYLSEAVTKGFHKYLSIPGLSEGSREVQKHHPHRGSVQAAVCRVTEGSQVGWVGVGGLGAVGTKE